MSDFEDFGQNEYAADHDNTLTTEEENTLKRMQEMAASARQHFIRNMRNCEGKPFNMRVTIESGKFKEAVIVRQPLSEAFHELLVCYLSPGFISSTELAQMIVFGGIANAAGQVHAGNMAALFQMNAVQSLGPEVAQQIVVPKLKKAVAEFTKREDALLDMQLRAMSNDSGSEEPEEAKEAGDEG